MVERDSEVVKSEKRQLDSIRRERDSIERLLNQARFENLSREVESLIQEFDRLDACLLYTSPSPRDKRQSRMPSSA